MSLILRFCMYLHSWRFHSKLVFLSLHDRYLLIPFYVLNKVIDTCQWIKWTLFLVLALKELILQLGEMVSKQIITQTMTTIMMLQWKNTDRLMLGPVCTCLASPNLFYLFVLSTLIPMSVCPISYPSRPCSSTIFFMNIQQDRAKRMRPVRYK